MAESLLQRLDSFIEHSRALVTLADQGDWAAFEARLVQRDQGLASLGDSQFLIAVAKAGLGDEMKARLADIQALNDEITQRATQGREQLSLQLRQLRQGDRAVAAYKRS